MITPTRTYDWDHGFCNLDEENFHFTKDKIVYPFQANDFNIFTRMSDQSSINTEGINTDPITCELKALPPVSLKLASQSDLEPFWDGLVRRYGYPGYGNLLGRRLKYIAFAGKE